MSSVTGVDEIADEIGLPQQHTNGVRRVFALLTKRTLVLLAIAFTVLFLALIVEHAANPQAPGIISINTLSELLREAAFAFLIAFAVIATVELESREERERKAKHGQEKFLLGLQDERNKFNETVKATLKDIQKDVFQATFERQIPKQIVDEINQLVFTSDFVRTHHHQTLTLRNITAAYLDENFKPYDLVELEVQYDYTVENVSAIMKQQTKYYTNMSGWSF